MNRALVDGQRRRRRYYIDQSGGNDASSGRSPGSAFTTIGQVNGMTFFPGDRVSLKRGETWTGECLVVPSNGMYIRDYGTHANQPIIDGNDVANCMTANDIEGIRLRNLHHFQGLDSCCIVTTCINVFVVNCEMSDSGNDNLLFIDGCENSKVTGGHYHDAYARVADGRLVTGIEMTNGADGIIIDAVEISLQQSAIGSGIGIHSHDGEAMPVNITVKNCNIHDNVGHGIAIWKQDDTLDDGNDPITIKDNLLVDNGQNGLQIAKTAPADEYPNTVLISGNFSEGNGNYAYIISGDNLEVYQNEFVGRGYVNGCLNSNFYNNTFYAVVGGGLYSVYIQTARTVVNFKNNIIFCNLAGGMAIGVANTVTGANVDIDYNLYFLNAENDGNLRWHWLGVSKKYADWLADSGQDANSPAVLDPTFVSDADPFDFTLITGSPAIDAGVDVGLTYLGIAPDCGANELE